jgi:hypothetical protein
MTGNGSVFDFSGPFPDGNGVDDLAARVFKRYEGAASGVCGAWTEGAQSALSSNTPRA